MKIGMTGTSKGMTYGQMVIVNQLIVMLDDVITEIHHGDCIGADAHFQFICEVVNKLTADIIIHPPTDPKKRAFMSGTKMCPEKDYLIRNRDIVNVCDILIATPAGLESEHIRSGTWATIRYAMAEQRKIYLIDPSGEMKVYNAQE